MKMPVQQQNGHFNCELFSIAFSYTMLLLETMLKGSPLIKTCCGDIAD